MSVSEIETDHKVDLTAAKVIGGRDILIGRTVAHLAPGRTANSGADDVRTKAADAEIRCIKGVKSRDPEFETPFLDRKSVV